jgi:Holliday junction resolvasome RuvABC endonuclease subunit
MISTLGIDLALNHSAFVELIDGELGRFWYVTDRLESFKKGKKQGRSVLLKVPTKDKDTSELWRLSWWRGFLPAFIETVHPNYIGLEDYAFAAKGRVYQIGELGGLARLGLWDSGVKFRLYDPDSVKMFVAHDGHADKQMVRTAVKGRWGIDFDQYDYTSKPNKKFPEGTRITQTSEDLCDAYAVARLVWTEILLRDGTLTMKELHEKEIQAFNRVTKAYPTNILGREFIQRPRGDYSSERAGGMAFESLKG